MRRCSCRHACVNICRQHYRGNGAGNCIEASATAMTTGAVLVQVSLPRSLQAHSAEPEVRFPDGMPVAAGSLCCPR